MATLDESIAATTHRLTQQLRRQAIKEYADKERERKAERKASADTRKAENQRKIILGGLIIAAGADRLDEAVIVGALLSVLASPPETQAKLQERGIVHMQARAASRKKS